MRRNCHLGIVLECLPLGALLPIAATTTAVRTKAIAETTVHAIRGLLAITGEQLVARHLVLERVSYLVGNHAAYGLAGRWGHPQGANHVVVARAGGHPPFGSGVEQVDLHLALPGDHHAQTGDVGLVEMLCFLQQVVYVDAVGLGQRGRVGVVAEIGVPEHEEVLTLLGAEPRPLRVVAEHVEVELLGLVVLVEVFYLRLVHDLYRRRTLGHFQERAGRAAAHFDVGHARGLRGVAGHLETEFLRATHAFSADELQPLAAILYRRVPYGTRGDGERVECHVVVDVDLRLRESRGGRGHVVVVTAACGKNRRSKQEQIF